jgi:HEAT repeat protein
MATIEFLVKKLASPDAEERREATVDLARAGAEAVPHLLRALGDGDWRVRKTAVEALAARRGVGVIEGLIATLSSHENAGARNAAIEALVQIGSEAVGRLLASLAVPDVDVRKFIVDILGEIRDSRAVPALIDRLADADENIRVAAAESLGKVRDRRAVDPLLACLARYDQGWLDYAAAEALGEIGDERALGPLIAALGRSSLREPVLEALGKIGNVKTLGPLITGLSDPLRIVREVSVVALVKIFRKGAETERAEILATVRSSVGDRAVEYLEELIITTGAELQKSAIAVLGWAGRSGSIPKLLALLKEEDLEDPVVHALADIDGRKAAQLVPYLADENILVRRTVARVLGRAGSTEAAAPLLRLLDDENGHVRSAAAVALGRLRSREAAGPLLRLLEDEYESVQEAAIRALADIGDETVLDGLVKNFSTRETPLRKNIALLLGRFATEKAADALAFALKDEEPDVRTAVVQALGALPAAKALRPLLLAITDDDPEVRMLAAEALGKTNAAGARQALVPLLEDDDLWVRAAAARGLGRISDAEAGRILVQHLGSATDIFLLALVEVIGRLKVEGGLEPLLALSHHADPEVRKTVLAALAGYGGAAVQKAVLGRLTDSHWSVRKTAVELLRQVKGSEAQPLLEKIAESDQDHIVRQAAREALGR